MNSVGALGETLSPQEADAYRQRLISVYSSPQNIPWGSADSRVSVLQSNLNKLATADGYKPMPETGVLDALTCYYIETLLGAQTAQNIGCPGMPQATVESSMAQRRLEPSTSTSPTSSTPYCEPRSNMCFDSEQERDTAVTQCQYNYKPDRGTAPCIFQQRFMYNNQHQYDPCAIKDFPVCPETAKEAAARITQEQQAAESTPVSVPTSYDEPVPTSYDAPPTSYDEPVATSYDDLIGLPPPPSVSHDEPVSTSPDEPTSVYAPLPSAPVYPAPAPTYATYSTPAPTYPTHSADPVPVAYDEPVYTAYDEPVVTPQAEPEEPEEDDEDRSMMIYGILAALAVGGGAVYLMTRKKKKKR